MEIVTERERLLKLVFPPNCLRCMARPAEARVHIFETTASIRSLHQPFSALSILLFLATGALVAGLSQAFETRLMWTWLFAYIFVVSLFRNFTEKNSRVIDVPYCASCLRQWERYTNIEYVLVFAFIFASSAAFFVGIHLVYLWALPAAWAGAFVLYFFVKGVLHRYDPPLDLRQEPQNSVSLNFGNADFAQQTCRMNTGLKEAITCPDCGAFVSLPSKQCPKCATPAED